MNDVKEVEVKSLLNKSKNPDDWFLGNYTINPYTGCSIACIYCYTRGSKYGGEYGSDVAVKTNAVTVFKRQLKNVLKRNERGFIILGSAADPYPFEEQETKITREILRVIRRYRFPLHILTKSTMVMRDIDILKDIGKNAVVPNEFDGKLDSGLIVSFSFSTTDNDLSKLLEPEAASPSERLETMKKIRDAGLKTGIINMPVLPYISDSKQEIESLISKAKKYGAEYVLFSGLTLYGHRHDDCRTLYYNFLTEHYPELVTKYDTLFGKSSVPSKLYQSELSRKYSEISYKYGIKNSIL